ncbi:MarR family transcriptional regulator [Macrococcus carouselicus]|nr:helix-turn-helix domain-containing protein [Macrococcus carouselicus]
MNLNEYIQMEIEVKRVRDKMNGKIEVTTEELLLLMSIYNSEGKRKPFRDILAETGRTSALASRYLKSLEKKGYLTRKRLESDERQTDVLIQDDQIDNVEILLAYVEEIVSSEEEPEDINENDENVQQVGHEMAEMSEPETPSFHEENYRKEETY